MDNNLEIPPMGGENVPFREPEKEKTVLSEAAKLSPEEKMPDQKKGVKRFKAIMIGVVLFLSAVILILLALLLKQLHK